MGLFNRRKNDSEDAVARLNQYIQPSAPAPAPAPAEAPESDDWETSEDLLEALVSPQDGWPPPRFEAGATGTFSEPQTQAPQVPAMAARSESREPVFFPIRPENIDDTGLTRPFVTDLLLRTLYAGNELTGAMMAERMALPFQGVVSEILESLRHEQAIEVKSQRGIGDAGYLYGITEKGLSRARDSMEKLTYIGPAPVPFDEYVKSALAQTVRNVVVTQETIREAFKDLIVNDSVLDEVGPAVNSGSSMFLFGYPGNGKTSIAERITKLMGDSIFTPYAVEVDGAVIKVFDSINHSEVEEKGLDGQPRRPDWDTRWVKIERPVVMVGGELTMTSLDLLFNPTGKYYEAPLQMKANGGMFLIDDFGRQMVRPQDLLNRWIVPLEKRVDFLTLVTGKKIAMPFEQLIVFSTNLDPKDLVDDAFLRRIKFKINVVDPDENQFRQIFRLMCMRRGVEFEETMFRYLLDQYYAPSGRPLRMCQPRDIIDQIISIAKYKIVPAEMTKSLIDRACETYFVSLS